MTLSEPLRVVLRPPDGLRFVLASSSPRRLDLLARIGLTPDAVDAADLDETPRRRELPRAYAARMAKAKAEVVASRHPGAFVLAADTVVACGRRILPKAETEAEARMCLGLLSGRRHRVIGGVCLIGHGGILRERIVETRVGIKRLTIDEIDGYLASGEWRGKAGGYAVQGLAGAFVSFLSGSHPNVVGLPLAETYAMLVGQGFRLEERTDGG